MSISANNNHKEITAFESSAINSENESNTYPVKENVVKKEGDKIKINSKIQIIIDEGSRKNEISSIYPETTQNLIVIKTIVQNEIIVNRTNNTNQLNINLTEMTYEKSTNSSFQTDLDLALKNKIIDVKFENQTNVKNQLINDKTVENQTTVTNHLITDENFENQTNIKDKLIIDDTVENQTDVKNHLPANSSTTSTAG